MRPTLLPRPIRIRLRRPSAYLVAAVALAALTGAVAFRLLDAAERGARRYGDPVTVAVARMDLRAGDRLDGDAVQLRRLPSSAVPSTAVRTRSIGRVLHAPLFAGQVLVTADLTAPGTSRLAAALPPGSVALAVPSGESSLHVVRGDRVDLLSVTSDGGLEPVASGAVVLARDSRTLTVGVRASEAGDVATAISAGTVVPALRGG